jgi:uridine kinase
MRGSTVHDLPHLIAIGGASCSGKTSIAAALVAALPAGSAVLLPLDSYYRDLSCLTESERATMNFDDPNALEWPLIREHVSALSRGNHVDVPEYDFVQHLRTSRMYPIEARPYVILEGLFALYDAQIRDRCAVRAYVEARTETTLSRRISRDVNERGRTRESVLTQHSVHVLPMAERYVFPTRRYANLLLDGAAPPEESARLILDFMTP